MIPLLFKLSPRWFFNKSWHMQHPRVLLWSEKYRLNFQGSTKRLAGGHNRPTIKDLIVVCVRLKLSVLSRGERVRLESSMTRIMSLVLPTMMSHRR
jgi:hypothetical protein